MDMGAEYFERLEQAGSAALSHRQRGAEKDDFAALEKSLEVILPEGLRGLWRQCNGMRDNVKTRGGLDGVHRLLSVAEAQADYVQQRADKEGDSDVPPAFLAVGTADGGRKLYVNCRPSSPTYGAVYQFSPTTGLARASNSMERYFETLAAWLEQGALRVDQQGAMVLDMQRSAQIARPMNAGCQFFHARPDAEGARDWE